MASIREVAPQYIGRRVIVHSTYGIHDGILHHCDGNGMYLRLMRGGAGVVSGGAMDKKDIVPLDELVQDKQISQVFWPFFFIPWLAAAAIYPWGLWW